MEKPLYPMRINKYLAMKKLCTRREADLLVEKGKVMINGRRAVLGDKVNEADAVETFFRPRSYRYFAYHKPRGIITHSPQGDEVDIAGVIPLKGVFPVGRLDKDSYGLIILTDDGRLTDALLNPDHAHEKEYEVILQEDMPPSAVRHMERGVDIEGYVTKRCKVKPLGVRRFSIILTEGKKHQIRRMCAALNLTVASLKRLRIMNVRLGSLKAGAHRAIEGAELETLLKATGLKKS